MVALCFLFEFELFVMLRVCSVSCVFIGLWFIVLVCVFVLMLVCFALE